MSAASVLSNSCFWNYTREDQGPDHSKTPLVMNSTQQGFLLAFLHRWKSEFYKPIADGKALHMEEDFQITNRKKNPVKNKKTDNPGYRCALLLKIKSYIQSTNWIYDCFMHGDTAVNESLWSHSVHILVEGEWTKAKNFQMYQHVKWIRRDRSKCSLRQDKIKGFGTEAWER